MWLNERNHADLPGNQGIFGVFLMTIDATIGKNGDNQAENGLR
jgi:hypothetical protein